MLRLSFLALFLSLGAYSQMAVTEGELIQAAGHDEIFIVAEGTKHHIQNPTWFAQNGVDAAKVQTLSAAELEAIPSGYPLPQGAGMPGNPKKMALDGVMLSDKDGKIYLVNKGRRHWILDAHWIAESRYAKQSAFRFTDAQLESIPLGGSIVYMNLATKIALPLLGIGVFLFLLFGPKLAGGTATRLIVAIVFIAAIGLREPNLLLQPRLWAEEGLDWFQYGTEHSVWKTLLYVYPISNYMNFAANVGAVLSSRTAAHFGLLYAPLATTLYSYLIQAAAIVAILFVKSRLFDSLWKAIAGCLIVLFASTTSDEIWLNSINSMSFLGMIALVLLFAEKEEWPNWACWLSRVALVFCGFSSPYALALLPIFFVSAWRSGEREQKIHCLILLFCVLAQAGIVVNSRLKIRRAGVDPMRATVVRPDASAVNMFVEHMLYPAVGLSLKEWALDVTGLKEASVCASSFPPRPFTRALRTGGWLCFIFLAGTLVFLRGPTLFSTTNMMMGVFLVESGMTCLASLYSVPTGRYAFMPGACFLLLILMKLDSAESWKQRYACMYVLACGLAAGMVVYPMAVYQEGPSWQGEVKKWEVNPSYSLRVWPSFFVAPVNITYPKRPGVK